LRDGRGELLPWALPSVEAVAIQRVASVRMDRFIADQEAKGKLKVEHLDMASKVGVRYHAALEREAMTLRSRLEATAGATDLATALARLAEADAAAAAARPTADVEGEVIDG
jgi:hypothetical protein